MRAATGPSLTITGGTAVDYDDRQRHQFREEFAARRKRQLLATVPLLLVVVAAVVADRGNGQLFGLGATTWGPVALVYVLGLLVFSLKTWRCPACDRYLGKGIFPRFCAKCGIQLSA